MLGLMGAIDVIGYYRLKDLQYHWPTTKFHTTDYKLDLKIYQQMDKMGHFLHAYFASDLTSKMYSLTWLEVGHGTDAPMPWWLPVTGLLVAAGATALLLAVTRKKPAPPPAVSAAAG